MVRILGFFLLLGGFVMLAWSLIGLATTGSWEPIQLGQAWANIHVNSLQVAQPAVERYLSPVIWQSIIGPVLLMWLWIVMIVVGFLLMLPAMLRER